MEEENKKNKTKVKKEISNKKAIIAIISIVILIGICVFVYANIRKKEDKCENNFKHTNNSEKYKESNFNNTGVRPDGFNFNIDIVGNTYCDIFNISVNHALCGIVARAHGIK